MNILPSAKDNPRQYRRVIRGFRTRFIRQLARNDLGAVKALVRVHWPQFDTVQIARMYGLKEPTVATALARVMDEQAARRRAQQEARHAG